MKNLKKVLAVMTSVAALCTSMSAFAAGATTYGQTEGKTGDISVFSFTYDGTANAINNITLTEAVADGDVTLLVVKPGVQRQNVTQSDIWYIDQTTKTAGFGTIARGLLDSITFTDEEKSATTATTKTAPVYVGYKNAAGEFAIAEAAVSATYTPETQATTITIKWGDVDMDGAADPADATSIIQAAAGGTKTWTTTDGSAAGYSFTWKSNKVTKDGKTYLLGTSENDAITWGDVDMDGAADPADATSIIQAAAGGTKVWNQKEWKNDVTITLTEVK